jgi:hypothetical protein
MICLGHSLDRVTFLNVRHIDRSETYYVFIGIGVNEHHYPRLRRRLQPARDVEEALLSINWREELLAESFISHGDVP